MNRYLLDTNIWSYIARNSFAVLNQRFSTYKPEQIYMSAVVWGELMAGYHKDHASPKRLHNLQVFKAHSQHLSIDLEVANTYAKIRADLELAGMPIGRNDTWIAAEALHHNLVVVTHNVDEFSRVKGLKVEDWTQE